ncbi:hypothetical protein Taro_022120 [Colocasia esculenta]|uniref:Uncharacterized protein n=1 Tax=Colocasia esculenta TaxID=4460 RepID=A0A843V4F9_COLES|nr:hypothetical protein [Colocasia esculenta]
MREIDVERVFFDEEALQRLQLRRLDGTMFGKMTRFITIKASESIFYLGLTLACMHLLKSPFHVRRLTMRRRRYLFVALGMITFTSFPLELAEFLFAAALTNVIVVFFSFFLVFTEAILNNPMSRPGKYGPQSNALYSSCRTRAQAL